MAIAKTRRGRPSKMTPELHNKIVDLLSAGTAVKEIVEDEGVSMSKVYEIMRHPTKLDLPVGDHLPVGDQTNNS